ncbi:MAG TPA: transporter [Bryobacteraceae bacterium]|nr:transporter [Bryobacteraceae bacterium]
MKLLALIAALLGCLARQSPADGPEPLTSDRPGFTDTVNVLPSGLLQLESGVNLSDASSSASKIRVLAGGNPLIRMGWGHRIELRYGGAGYETSLLKSHGTSTRCAGMSDFAVGMKLALTGEHGWRPSVSLESMVSLPVGAAAFTSAGADPTFKLAWSKSLSATLAASGNFNVSSLSTPFGRYTQRAVTARLDRGVWRKLAGFVDTMMTAPVSPGGSTTWMMAAGLEHPLGSNAQLDLSVGQQAVPIAHCWFVGAGVVFRQPLWHGQRK